MLKLKSFEVCKYGNICPFSSGCYGLNSDRDKNFTCDLICFENGEPYFPKNKNRNKNEFDMDSSDKKILHG